MKITIEKKEMVEIEISFPRYARNGSHYYKIEENQTTVLFVSDMEHSFTVHGYMSKYPLSYMVITENEFSAALEELKSKINLI
ncbi:MAG: hypothetical protein RIR01_1934 [Bacteroidota bacterium]|jgi:hypothetical protein